MRFVERIAGLKIPGIRQFRGDRRDRGRGEMRGEPPGRAHEGGAIDPGDVATRLVVGADIAGHHAVGDIGAELVEGTVASPAIGYAADFLVELPGEIARPADPVEAG